MDIRKNASDTFSGFKQFILRGNVVDLAVGVVFGAAFSGLINALVKDLVTPLIAAIFTQPDFSLIQFTIRGSHFAIGDFLNVFLSFLILAAVVYFLIVLPMNALVARSRRQPPVDPTEKKCPQCKGDIPIDATRCKFCTQLIA
ncbi:large conductance mechanosensitive channel protein MscL [Candidatus Kaiserbacteria bacterium]|nr:large conductance mechanosensitive channel protein MscL [Candidatus Kaiserbacteria bacterium]